MLDDRWTWRRWCGALCGALGLAALSLAAPSAAQETPPETAVAEEGAPAAAEQPAQASEDDVGEEPPAGEQGEAPITWNVRTRYGNQGRLSFPSGDRAQPRVEIGDVPTGVAWHIRLALGPFPMEGKTGYLLSFRARSDGPRTMTVGVSQARPPFRGIAPAVQVDLTPLWTSYRTRIRIEETEEATSLQFNLGGQRYSVEVSDVVLTRLSDGAVVLEAPSGPVERERREARTSAPG